MSEQEQSEKLRSNLLRFLKDDEMAVNYCMALVYIAHLWDDLVDRDKERTAADINTAFRLALVDVMANPFVQQHLNILWPKHLDIFLQWQDANVLDHGSAHDRRLAFVHRASVTQIFNVCAFLVGGPEWAAAVGPEIRRLYEEDFEQYEKEMSHA